MHNLIAYGVESIQSSDNHTLVNYTFPITDDPMLERAKAVRKCLFEREKLNLGLDKVFEFHRRVRLYLEYSSDFATCKRVYLLDGDPDIDHILDNLHAEYVEYELSERKQDVKEPIELVDQDGYTCKIVVADDFYKLIYFYTLANHV